MRSPMVSCATTLALVTLAWSCSSPPATQTTQATQTDQTTTPAEQPGPPTGTVSVGVARAFVVRAATAAREQPYAATYQVGEDPMSSAEVQRESGRSVVVLAGTKLGSGDTPLGSEADPVSLYLRVHPGTILVACGTEAGARRCYDLAPLLDAPVGQREPLADRRVFGTTAFALALVPALLSLEPAAFDAIAAEMGTAESAGLFYSLDRRTSPVGDVLCLAVAESAAGARAGETEGFCVNGDGVRATSLDASEEFASNLIAYQPTVDHTRFKLPAEVRPLTP